jgi:hypothetical protein
VAVVALERQVPLPRDPAAARRKAVLAVRVLLGRLPARRWFTPAAVAADRRSASLQAEAELAGTAVCGRRDPRRRPAQLTPAPVVVVAGRQAVRVVPAS